MLFKTNGIVLGFIKYRESSIIATIYTRKFGPQKYIVNGVRTKRPKYNPALFQPLTLVNMVVYHNSNRELHRISEIKCEIPFSSIPFQLKKTSIALFVSEVLSKSLREGHENDDLFNFLHNSILALDQIEPCPENFHLQFLLKLTRYLGFEPISADLIVEELSQQGQVTVASDSDLNLLGKLKSQSYMDPVPLNSNSLRRRLLKMLLEFYSLHIESFSRMRSPKVLLDVIS